LVFSIYPPAFETFCAAPPGVELNGSLVRTDLLTHPDNLTEEQLIPLLVRRDQQAFLRVYREHAPLIARMLVRMGIGSQDIEDAVQTTFVEAMASVGRFEGRASIRGWLLSVALNQARNHIRARIRARTNAPLLAEVAPQGDPGAEDALSGAQQMDRLQRALDRLPELQREALVLCELSELPAREVSALLGVPAGTVWRRVHDAKTTLRKLLTEGDPG